MGENGKTSFFNCLSQVKQNMESLTAQGSSTGDSAHFLPFNQISISHRNGDRHVENESVAILYCYRNCILCLQSLKSYIQD